MSLSELIHVFILFAVFFPSPSRSHPQCLDFQPPYQDSQVTYCSEYSEFGCCWRVTDRRASKRVDHLLTRTRAGLQLDRNLCEPYLRNVSCTACSPYAAHLFDIEDSRKGRDFPYLCRAYCEEAYQACRRILLRLYKLKAHDFGLKRNPSSQEVLVNDSKSFCSEVIPTESPYCYPRVLQGPQIGGGGRPSEPIGDLGCLCVLPVAKDLRNPLFAIHSGDQTGRLFVGEQVGVVWVLMANNTKLQTPFLDASMKVFTSGRQGDERGLLGMVFHPDYSVNGKFFVYYSTLINGRHFSKVSELSVSSGNSNVADPESEREVLKLQQPAGNHNGGQLLFKDGYLLIVFGDGGGGGDRFGTRGNGQNKGTWFGSILRIDVDNYSPDRPYSIPSDNPFVNESNAKPEIFAFGLRNAWRCSVDRGDPDTGGGRGRVFCGDVGQNKFEEIDIVVKGGNYGWRAYEGNSCFDRRLCSEEAVGPVIPPIDVYDHQSVGVSVTGGYVYRGCLFPNLRGLYIYGDYGSGALLALRENKETGAWQRNRLCMGDGDTCTGDLIGTDRKKFILSFGEDEDGELYILTTSDASPTARKGVVYQIIDPSRRARPIACRRRVRKLEFKG